MTHTVETVTESATLTLGECAYQAIQKHFHKTLKWEPIVKKDEDPEALHQMRVGLRRLRTSVSGFKLVVNLPKSVSDRIIGKIARNLGELRDFDVLQETLETNYQPNLPDTEAKSLQKLLHQLQKHREDAAIKVKETLKGSHYKSLKHDLNQWLEEPAYQLSASLPIQLVTADLLSPELSRLLLHPGLLVGTKVADDAKQTEIEQEITANSEALHSLRKQAKHLRYQMELFVELYDENYSTYLAQIKQIQEILGNIQDSMVLEAWLVKVFGSQVKAKFPSLTHLLASNRYQFWQEWQIIKQNLMQYQTRNDLHLLILQPLNSN
ncbi:CHAD domain-containing protein [Calothrix sp. PCC 6303]|uniref:CHAD domain-containing protein n=1 Tax=Calothrix sp. PCC 6303 TaxID=1170562 RepID=UPI0002A02CDF|nr:CHAD domain-containing protein [Calothrix sp. PCC 6303]AFZ03056.1 CHAD domain containing protein [Calothrix sp. PCC 6303]